ncbi:hypothetical protein HAX54_051512 [Datura stramonium]|uniref:Uncharacterized protein n=1 Tax=Datura stramonium TaxID=4076 RepID=A0ABS8SYK1_DATST|nr:hypothetical protein [Datura stramonium]
MPQPSTKNRTKPLPYMPSSTPEGQFQAADAPATTPPDLLKIAQMAQVHESQIVKLAKAIPSMIHALEIVSDEEIYHNRPPSPPMLTVQEVDPSWKLDKVDTTSNHDLRTLLDKWLVPGPGKLLEIPPDPLMSIAKKMASWNFDAATYSWGLRPNR